MKIAILSPIAWRTPPATYGPWEQVASNIAEGILDKGGKGVDKVPSINRKHCREWACSKFSREEMINKNLDVYNSILNQ